MDSTCRIRVREIRGYCPSRRDIDATVHGVGVVGLALLLAATLAVTVASAVVPAEHPGVSQWATVAVDPRGTLWDLAVLHPVDGLSTSETVDLIRAENSLASSSLRVGQTLRVPASASTCTSVAQR